MGLLDIFKSKNKESVTNETVNVTTQPVDVSGSLNLTKGTSLKLTKGSTVSLDFTKSTNFDKPLTNLEFACGWDTRCDLDIYCAMGDATDKVINVVYFGNKNHQGIRLNGDNTTGEGNDDDEIIFVDLNNLDSNITHLDFYVNIYTKGKSFGEVKGAYSVLRDMNNSTELCRINLTSKDNTNSLYAASLNKIDGVWYFTAKDESFFVKGYFNDFLKGNKSGSFLM